MGEQPASLPWTAELARWDRDAVQQAALAAARVALDTLYLAGEELEIAERDDLEAKLEAAEAQLAWPRPKGPPVFPVEHWRPGPRDFPERIALRWSVRACVRAAMTACQALRDPALQLLAAASHAAHALAGAGPAVTEPAHVAARAARGEHELRARVVRSVVGWLLAGPREADAGDREPSSSVFFAEDHPGLLPAFVLGWQTRDQVEPPPPLLALDHQAGGFAITHHPRLVGRLLPFAANLDRLGPFAGRLLCALTLLDEAGGLFPAVDGVTGTRGGPLDGGLVALERFVREHLPGVPAFVDGVEAFVRLAPGDLRWLLGWRCLTQGPLGLEGGPALDPAGLDALASWGRAAGLGPPGVTLLWLNCD